MIAAPVDANVVEAFRAMHGSGCFILPNPWDTGSAVYLAHAGYKALATTSAGFAFSRGLPDAVWSVPRDMMLSHIREMVTATPLPVKADFQSGYAHEPESVAANVALCVATGVAGLSIEDATGSRRNTRKTERKRGPRCDTLPSTARVAAHNGARR